MELLIVLLVTLLMLALVIGAGAFFVSRRSVDQASETLIEQPPAETEVLEPEVEVLEPEVVEPEVIEPEVIEELVRPRFRDRLGKARSTLSGYVGSVLSRSEITQASYEELEEALILADLGIGSTQEVLDAVRTRVNSEKLTTSEELMESLKSELVNRLGDVPPLNKSGEGPSIFLIVGVNGVGKTTTIGKLGHRLGGEGNTIVMAAGDTFRAAAAEQLETWAQRCGATMIRGSEGGDPSSVIFDAVEAAGARDADYVLADTAGRLHTKSNLMDELSKVRRVADRGAGSVVEVLLVIDATTGQNGLIQARQFAEATDVTGVVLTKLDGSAKGGIVFAIVSELDLPVKLVGLGEAAVDLVDFDPEEFVSALFDA